MFRLAASRLRSPIVQLPGTAGCVTEGNGSAGACANGVALDTVARVVVSPDGRNVYATALVLQLDRGVYADRNPATGALTQKAGIDGCISETGTGGLCAHGVALVGASDVVVSPDGRSVYATAVNSNSVLIYDRDLATGELLFKVDILGCVSDDGTGDQCINGNALNVSLGSGGEPGRAKCLRRSGLQQRRGGVRPRPQRRADAEGAGCSGASARVAPRGARPVSP